jgi:hypothetical protein
VTILRTILAGLILVVAASAADAKDMWPPFAKYDSGPLMNARYPKPIISHLSPARLIVACRGKHLACSYAEIGSPCRIFLPKVGWEKMVRHEMGHCRGWSADHKR